MATHTSKLRTNIRIAGTGHKELYLGSSALQPFTDARLYVSGRRHAAPPPAQMHACCC